MKHRVIFCSIATLVATSVLFAQTSLNVDYLGNWNLRSTPSGFYSPYSACWGYTAPNGREYALLGSTLGTSIIDITDAPTLTEVAFIQGPTSNWREMKTYQEYAYIVSDQSDGVTPNGVQIVSLANLPTSASFVKTYIWADTVNSVVTSYQRAHTVSTEGKYVYLNGGGYNGIRILDLTDPVDPVKAGRYVGPSFHDSYIRNDTIYASAINAGGGLDIIDARNKSNPTRIKLHQYPGSGTHNAWTSEDGRYVLTTDEINSTPKTLKVWDMTNIQNLVKVAEVASVSGSDTTIVHNVVVRGNLAYVAWYTAGVKVFDISNPTSPQLVAHYDTYPAHDRADYAGVWGVYPFPSGKFIVSDMQTGLHVLRYPSTSTSVGIDTQTPKGYLLHQNYPNPFNPKTNFEFRIANFELVALRVYDVLGREVATLLNEQKAPGVYTIFWDASHLPSGVYYYRMSAETFVQTKKLMLLK